MQNRSSLDAAKPATDTMVFGATDELAQRRSQPAPRRCAWRDDEYGTTDPDTSLFSGDLSQLIASLDARGRKSSTRSTP